MRRTNSAAEPLTSSAETDVLSVAAMTARKDLGEDVGPLALATALIRARRLQRATTST